jgi:hypothetical protein
MKPGESIRYACDECQALFDLCLAPVEWVAPSARGRSKVFDSRDADRPLDVTTEEAPARSGWKPAPPYTASSNSVTTPLRRTLR